MRTIFLIGGLGFRACIHIEFLICRYCKRFKIHLPNIVSVNTAQFDSCAEIEEDEVKAYIQRCLELATLLNHDRVGIACNTHAIHAPNITNPIDCTLREIEKNGDMITLLGTPQALQIYKAHVDSARICDTDQSQVDYFIDMAEQGRIQDSQAEFTTFIAGLSSRPVLICTELSMYTYNDRVIDSSVCFVENLLM